MEKSKRLYDWTKVPEWCEWVAVDREKGEDVAVWGYERKPGIALGTYSVMWSNMGLGVCKPLDNDVILQSVHWEDSLEQRPE